MITRTFCILWIDSLLLKNMKDLCFQENYFKRQCSTVVKQTHPIPKCRILTMFA